MRALGAFAAFVLVSAVGASASAAEVRVFAAGAVQAAVADLAPRFESASGHKLVVTVDTVGALRDRVLAGEAPDVVMLSDAALKLLAERDRLVPSTTAMFGRTGIGIAGRLDAPAVDLATVERFKAFLLSAPSLAYADPARGATAGIHFRGVLAKLDLEAPLRARIQLVPFGGDGVHAVAAGRVAVAVSQATEIVSVPEVKLLGLLPDDLQLWTVYGAAAVAPARSEAAASWLAFLQSVPAAEAFRRVGFAR